MRSMHQSIEVVALNFERIDEKARTLTWRQQMKNASWIILSLAGGLTLLGSLVSLGIAYGSVQDQIGPVTLAELSVGRPDVAIAVRARRATAAAYGAGF